MLKSPITAVLYNACFDTFFWMTANHALSPLTFTVCQKIAITSNCNFQQLLHLHGIKSVMSSN